MIINGRPCSIFQNGYKDTSLITDRSEETQETVFKWISENLIPGKSKYGGSSYNLKHILQTDTNIYLTDNEFKDAMLLSGYQPIDSHEFSWHYRLSAKSPAFHRRQFNE